MAVVITILDASKQRNKPLSPTGVLSTSFDIQTPLSTVWTSLKNRVFGNKITISLPLPDPMGNVDLSVDTSQAGHYPGRSGSRGCCGCLVGLSVDTSKLDTTQVGLGLEAVVVMWTSILTPASRWMLL